MTSSAVVPFFFESSQSLSGLGVRVMKQDQLTMNALVLFKMLSNALMSLNWRG